MSSHLYDDIINLPHPEPMRHKRMSRENRAAQFAPFAALTGYENAVDETGRLTDRRIEISEEKKQLINKKIMILMGDVSDEKMPQMIIYYVPDKYKSGGAYVSCSASVKKIIKETNNIVTNEGITIPIENIFDIR